MENDRIHGRGEHDSGVKTKSQREEDPRKSSPTRSEDLTDSGVLDRIGSEISPLLGDTRPPSRGEEEEQREEWAGEFDFVGLPWYKTPSVRAPYRQTAMTKILIGIGLLAVTKLPHLRPGIWWYSGTKTEPHSYPHLP